MAENGSSETVEKALIGMSKEVAPQMNEDLIKFAASQINDLYTAIRERLNEIPTEPSSASKPQPQKETTQSR